MNNEEKILSMLETLTADMSVVKSDVNDLKQGQAALEKGQAALEKGQAALEKGLSLTNAKLDKVIATQDRAEDMIDTLIVTTGSILMDVAEIKGEVIDLGIGITKVRIAGDENELRFRLLEKNRKTS